MPILEESDFYPQHELKILVPQNEKILAAAVIEKTDDTCKVKIVAPNRKENEAVISFYCLEPQQGATILRIGRNRELNYCGLFEYACQHTVPLDEESLFECERLPKVKQMG